MPAPALQLNPTLRGGHTCFAGQQVPEGLWQGLPGTCGGLRGRGCERLSPELSPSQGVWLRLWVHAQRGEKRQSKKGVGGEISAATGRTRCPILRVLGESSTHTACLTGGMGGIPLAAPCQHPLCERGLQIHFIPDLLIGLELFLIHFTSDPSSPTSQHAKICSLLHVSCCWSCCWP